jgi:hypothetical protein
MLRFESNLFRLIVGSLNASTFMNCLRRFTARNGVPTRIVSDNAKQFKATERALSARRRKLRK